jgi:hypothetical protein
VLNALEHRYRAENETGDALADYAVAAFNFYRDTETLQVRPDGTWQRQPDLPISAEGTRAGISLHRR